MNKQPTLVAVREHIELMVERVVHDVPTEDKALAHERQSKAMQAGPQIRMALLHAHRARTRQQAKRVG